MKSVLAGSDPDSDFPFREDGGNEQFEKNIGLVGDYYFPRYS
jgi:hypothetical protein